MVSVVTGLVILGFPIAVAGPIVTLGYSKVVRSNRFWFWVVFFLELIVAYVALFQVMALNWGHNFPGLGYEAYQIYVAVVTGVIFLTIGFPNWKTFSSSEKIGYTIGGVLVLLFQFSARFWFQVMGPILLSEWSVCSWLAQFDLPCW